MNNVFTPAEVGSLTASMVQDRAETTDQRGVSIGLPIVDDYFLPARPGELVTVIGRPSNYKSGLMQHVARAEAIRIAADGEQDRKAVFYVTWEQAIEEMTLMELASQTGQSASDLARGILIDRNALVVAAAKRGSIPLWLVGHSIQRRTRRPHMTMSDVHESILSVEDEFGIRPSMIVLDYLQRIHHDTAADVRVHNMRNVDAAKDLALAVGAPVFLGCQAKRDVDERRVKIPTMGDGAETSNIEHSSDRILTVWMPKTSEAVGSVIPNDIPAVGGFAVEERMLVLFVAKQKLGPAGQSFLLEVVPERNEIKVWR